MATNRTSSPKHGTYPQGCTLAYLRVSTSEQADSGAGLDAQRTAITAYATRNGLRIDKWFIDPGVRGSVPPLQRPALSEALTALSDCKSGALLIAKTDRVARMTADLLALRKLSEKQGWTLSAADGSVDWSTPHGRAMSTVMGAFAELERELIASRTRDGLAAKRDQGVRLGRTVTLPADIRQRIADERAAGRTLDAIAGDLNSDAIATARGGQRWYGSTVNAVLSSLAQDAYAVERRSAHTDDE